MATMPTPAAHAKPAPGGRIAAWLCLVIAGAATVTFNIVHAWRSGMASPLGFVEGVVPVALAMIVSHLVATSPAGKFLKGITFAVMIGALALSVRATGTVVAPAAGPLWWLYGAVVDTAALVSLQVLLSLRSRAAQYERDRAAAETAVADERVALRRELEAQREAFSAAQAERDEAQKEAADIIAKAEVMERKLAAAAGSKRTRRTTQKKVAAAPATKVPRDVSVQAEALAILTAEPGISGKDLGDRVGRSERWGQDFKKNLAGSAADPQARGES